MKFGAANPNALLSRSVAGVAGKTQIYTLPGSVRAVEEYLGEILKTMEHVVSCCMGWTFMGMPTNSAGQASSMIRFDGHELSNR